jgi:hypothetical protein
VLLLVIPESAPSWPKILVISLCPALAVWAKQSVLPVYGALIVIAALRFGRKSALTLGIAGCAIGILVSLIFLTLLPTTDIVANMITVPAQHPWWKIDPVSGEIDATRWAATTFDRIKMIVAGFFHLIRSYWPLVIFLLGAIWSIKPSERAFALLKGRRWPAFLVVALFMLPTAVIGRLKVGGAINHETFFLFFLVVAAVLWILETASGERSAALQPHLIIALSLFTLINLPQIRDYHGWRTAWNNQNEVAYRYLKANPHGAYFPWNPLSSWLAERKLYHFDYGVYDRNLGKAQVSSMHLRAYLPSERPKIASYYAHHDYILKTYFPDYSLLEPDPDLKEWRIYGQPERSSK